MIIPGFISLVALIHLSLALFEECDETFNLEADTNLTISSEMNVKKSSSCRYTILAPRNFIVEVNCELKISQPDSHKCPIKRFFISVDGIKDLKSAEYFCSRNGSTRSVKRKSILNRLVVAFASKTAVGGESFTCVARTISSRCDCGWSRRVRCFLSCHLTPDLIKFQYPRQRFTMGKTPTCTSSLQS